MRINIFKKFFAKCLDKLLPEYEIYQYLSIRDMAGIIRKVKFNKILNIYYIEWDDGELEEVKVNEMGFIERFYKKK